MTLRLATWNINSVRIRLELLHRLAEAEKPDILCLQETKVEDDLFPTAEIKALGFPYLYFSGQKSYNGVAILSKIPLEEVRCLPVVNAEHKRHISAVLPGGIELHNFYVPAGGDIPDPALNSAFDFKLQFVESMRAWFAAERAPDRRMILVGDLNIAPLEHDVWSHKQLLKVVSHTPVETESLEKLRSGLQWCDGARRFVPGEQKLYSWWSYRNRDWRKSDRGRRLDHIWVSTPLAGNLASVRILKDARDWESPSDHVPVLADINL